MINKELTLGQHAFLPLAKVNECVLRLFLQAVVDNILQRACISAFGQRKIRIHFTMQGTV